MILYELHQCLNNKQRFNFPFANNINQMPENGIYICFEKGEKYQTFDRIVRVGTHTGDNQLRSRLNQHFLDENKDRSIFRKNVGRCFLHNDPYLPIWNLDNTTREARIANEGIRNIPFEQEIEERISKYITQNITFCLIPIDNKEDRLFWESKIASTLAQGEIIPSANWLGNQSPKEEIRTSGLWQVQGLNKPPLTNDELARLFAIIGCPPPNNVAPNNNTNTLLPS
ncbi:MAG: hypothetical protein QM528_07430 [Phycisphaerales bacterium]|nr:hypothetical protein [Phycisphaerales bacterium]